MAASCLLARPDANGMIRAVGIELDVVIANRGRPDPHAMRMAAARNTQTANVTGTGRIEMAAIAATFPVHAHPLTVPKPVCQTLKQRVSARETQSGG